MPNDYYADAEAETAPPEQESAKGETTLIPKSFFADAELEPGSTVEVKVVSMRGNEVEVEKVSEEMEPEDELAPAAPAPEGMGMSEMME